MTTFEKRLLDFADTFYGYGDYQAPYWFIGMEEGGGDCIEDVKQKLQLWDERGRAELEDLGDFHRSLARPRWLKDHPPLQSTWAKLIRLILCAQKRGTSIDEIRAFQQSELGRQEGLSALVELLPLPSPSTARWLYAENSRLPQLASRKAYRRHYAPLRAEHLRNRIAKHRPRAVVFYGKSYRRWWRAIAGTDLRSAASSSLLHADSRGTSYALLPHPTARGTTNKQFEDMGRAIAALPG